MREKEEELEALKTEVEKLKADIAKLLKEREILIKELQASWKRELALSLQILTA